MAGKGHSMGWFSDFFSGKRAEETPQQTSSPIKQHLFCKSRFSEVGHLASMVR
jgi:hypothetical protein